MLDISLSRLLGSNIGSISQFAKESTGWVTQGQIMAELVVHSYHLREMDFPFL